MAGRHAFQRLLGVVCEGSRGERVLKGLCCPLMLPIGVAAAAGYFLLTRGWRLFKWLCSTGLPALCGLVAEGCTHLWVCLGSVYNLLVSCFAACYSCWSIALEWIARHVKTALYGVYDSLFAPVLRFADYTLFTPVQRLSTACCEATVEHCARPFCKLLCQGILPAVGKALGSAVTAASDALVEADYRCTACAIYISEHLWSGLVATWQGFVRLFQVIKPSCEAVGRGLQASARAMHRTVLLPLWQAIRRVASAIGRGLGEAAGWLLEQVMLEA